MIDHLELARLYAKRFAQPVFNKEPNPARIKEYRAVGSLSPTISDEDALEQMENLSGDGLEGWLQKLREILVKANPNISPEAKTAPIIQVDSYDQYTSLRTVEKTQSVIYVDTGLLTFLWRMNKAYLYGDDSGTHSSPLLTAMTIAHHAAQMRPPVWAIDKRDTERIFPAPQTPPHKDPNQYHALMGLTIEHECFVLAHEMAHAELGHLRGAGKREPNNDDLHQTVAIWFKDGIPPQALREFDADGLALQWCVNLFGLQNPSDTEGILMMIFQLSRYLVFLELALREYSDQKDVFLWAARHFRLRRFIAAFGPQMAHAAVKHSEWLEENWERGAFLGIELYKMVLKGNGREALLGIELAKQAIQGSGAK